MLEFLKRLAGPAGTAASPGAADRGVEPLVSPEYPFRPNFLDARGVRMHYLDEGTGHPVVMVHGNPTWSYYYRNLVRALAGRFRCIAPDHIGCGLSSRPARHDVSLKGRIDDLAHLVDRLALPRFDLVVHDWGGAIGLGLATRMPERIHRVVILNSGAFRSGRIPLRIAACRVPGFGRFAVQRMNLFLLAARRMGTCKPGGFPDEVWRGYLHPYRRAADRAAIADFVADIPMERHHPSYGTLRHIEERLVSLRDKPVFLAWGARDFCFTLHFFRRYLQYFPDAVRIVYSAAGHFVLEDAAPDIERRIGEFLAAPDPPRAAPGG